MATLTERLNASKNNNQTLSFNQSAAIWQETVLIPVISQFGKNSQAHKYGVQLLNSIHSNEITAQKATELLNAYTFSL